MQFAPTLTWTRGSHTMKVGYDWRSCVRPRSTQGWRGGAYAFDGTYTRASSTAVSQYGQGIASFLLGPAAQRVVHRAPSGAGLHASISHGVFVHDDWRDRRTADAQSRCPLRPRAGHDRGREPQHARLRLHARPIRSRRRRRRSSPPIRPPACRSPPRSSRVLGGYQYCRRRQSHASGMPTATTSSRASGSPTRSTTARSSSAAAPGCSSRRSRSAACPGLGNPVNQLGYSRNTPVPVTSRQRADVPGELDQSRAERPARCSRSDRPGAADQPGRQRRRASSATDRDQSRISGASASASRSSCRRTGWSRCRTWARRDRNLPIHRAAQLRARSSTARRARSATTPPRRSSARWCPTRSRG